MHIDPRMLLAALAVGIGATLVMDLWNLALKWTLGIPSLDYCLLGRWVLHLPGTVRHESIAAAEPKRSECAAGWITHYGIGMTLALVFTLLLAPDWLAAPTLPPALLYGLVTVVFPFFLLQPALGLGVASSRTKDPSRARMKSLATHLVFGIGLYACGVGVSRIL